MDKPITVIITETKTNLVNVANESKLPVWILRDIFKDITGQIAELAMQQEQKEAQDWAAYQKEQAEEPAAGEDET